MIQALGGPTAILGLFLLLDEVEAVAEREQVRALAALQAVAAKNKKKKTNPGDPMAKAMTEFAAFAYEKLTAKRIDQGTKSDAFESFLERIFGAYQIDANPQYCIRQFKEERRGEITK